MIECMTESYVCCSTWEEMTADRKHPIIQSPAQTYSDQLDSLQSPRLFNTAQPSMAIMDATLNLDLSTASIPSFAAQHLSACHPQHYPQFVSQPSPTASPVSHDGCMDPVNGVNLPQQHACNSRTAAEKTGKIPITTLLFCTVLHFCTLYRTCRLSDLVMHSPIRD